MTVTLRFQSSGAVPRDGRPILMRGPSLTIGRGAENDVVLPDPDRMISKTHCVIENHNGSIVVMDLSTNGTFLNYGKVALGRVATPVNDGDVLCLGPYELVVNITPDQAASPYDAPMDPYPTFAEPLPPLGEERASFGNAKAAPDPYKLLDDAAPGGDFLDSLLGAPKPTGPGQFRKEAEPVDLLPPLGDDGPLLAPAPEMPTGPAMRDHSAAVTDSFLPAQRTVSKSVIPDDWDDFLAPTPPARPAPQPQALQPGQDIYTHTAPAVLPDEDFLAPPASRPLDPRPEPLPQDDDLFAPAIRGADIPPEAPLAASAPMPPVSRPLTPQPEPVAPPYVQPSPAVEPQPAETAVEAPDASELDPFVVPAPPFDPFSTDPNRPVVAVPVQSAVVAAPATEPLPAAASPVGGTDAARAFLAALGAEEVRITDAELPDAMARLGRTLKSMITGLREILMTRTSIKSEFRIEQTMVTVGGNNPLKFSVSPEQAIEAMVKPTARGYLPAEAAATQALEDIKAHEIAMMTGMEAALKGVLAKLNPALLTTRIEAKGGFGGFLKNRKAQYWETYETMYAEISDQAENDFNELFAKEFAQAYRAQLARLKEAKSRG